MTGRCSRFHAHRILRLGDDPRGRHYLWIGGPGGARNEPVQGADTEALDEGYISVTPLSIEATQPEHFGVAAYVAGPEEKG